VGGGEGGAVSAEPGIVRKRWRTIVVDPPWAYRDKLRMGSGPKHRGADAHYTTSSTAALRDLPIGEYAERDAHLYLWVTNAFLEDGHALARAWGFQQRTMITWCKTQIGMGHYFRNSTEHALFCVRGKLALLRKDLPTHFTAPRGRHSEKPQAFYDMVETASPGPYLDVFARRHRMLWDVAGNEVYSAIPELAARAADGP